MGSPCHERSPSSQGKGLDYDTSHIPRGHPPHAYLEDTSSHIPEGHLPHVHQRASPQTNRPTEGYPQATKTCTQCHTHWEQMTQATGRWSQSKKYYRDLETNMIEPLQEAPQPSRWLDQSKQGFLVGRKYYRVSLKHLSPTLPFMGVHKCIFPCFQASKVHSSTLGRTVR